MRAAADTIAPDAQRLSLGVCGRARMPLLGATLSPAVGSCSGIRRLVFSGYAVAVSGAYGVSRGSVGTLEGRRVYTKSSLFGVRPPAAGRSCGFAIRGAVADNGFRDSSSERGQVKGVAALGSYGLN